MKGKAVSLILGVLLAVGTSAQAYADTAEAYYAEPEQGVSMSYDEETGMYMYSLGGGEFWCSELLDSSGTVASALWIGTESPDIGIRITLDGEPFAYSPTMVLDTVGIYDIEISYSPDSERREVVSYTVEIAAPDEVGSELPSDVEGRLELSPDDDGYSYSFEGVGDIWTNVLDGETVSFPAKVLVSDGLYCTVTRDGAIYSLPQNGLISEDGSYSVTVTAYLSNGSSETRYFGFNVYTGASSRLGIYHPPLGYSIEGVLLNGGEYPFETRYCSFERDGEYTVTYSCGNDSRTVVLCRDTVAPVLYFNGGSGVIFDEAVTVTADSPCTVTAEKNGMPIGGVTELKGTGIYRVTAVDAAGNTTSARIEITAVSAINPMNFVLIFGAAAAAALVYFIIQKNKRPVVR